MSEELMLKCLIAFILGWLASRMMVNGFRVGGTSFKKKLEAEFGMGPSPRKCTPPTSDPLNRCGADLGCTCPSGVYRCSHPNECCEDSCANYK